MYLKYKNGFYVNNKLEDDGYKFKSIKELIRYVTRYCSRPVIAESLITKILRHLLPSNYKSIRYYGFYNKSNKLCDKLITIIKKRKNPIHTFYV